MNSALIYVWNGEAMEPVKYYATQAAKIFRVGQAYRLQEVEPRSMTSHRHFFSCIAEAWANLPEDHAERFRTPDELRKWALTHTDFREVREFTGTSHTEALRVARFLGGGPDYSRVVIDGKKVTQYLPHSQAINNMNSREFQASKSQVLDILAEKLGVSVEELKANAGRAA